MSQAAPFLKTALFTLVAPCSVAGWIPFLWIAPDAHLWRSPLAIPGWLLIAAGWLIYLVCAFDFSSMGDATPAPIDPPKRLVAGRLYRLTRNPMYVGVLMAVLGDAIVLRSIAIVEYAAVIAILFHLFVVYYEESALRRKFGESYVQYSARVPRWFGRRAK